ncbi:MAG: DNA polymerase III subunit alpha [Treponema sp.]|jgi:DNA polymerase-3 subunit alpha|nr:DNA polymerase III subunit alpha [Treponema sp.]
MVDFVHLHVHSDFSLQDAAVSVMALADRAEEFGMRYLALTDHGNMFGAMEFLRACKETINETTNEKGEQVQHYVPRENPIHPIIGCEVYVSPNSRFEKKGTENENNYYHLILLATNRKGYMNLMKLCSFAYTEGFYYRPRVDEDLLGRYHEGLIALSACVSGEIPKLIQAGMLDKAEQKALHYRELFGEENFFLEIQDHGIPAGVLRSALSQKQINDALVAISRRTGIPLAATNDVHYLTQADATAHDILLCIGTGKPRTEEKRKRYYGDQFYFKSGDEMAALFSEYPEAIANTVRIAERCVTDVPRVNIEDLSRYLPAFEIPPDFPDADSYLRHLTMEGLAKRYPGEVLPEAVRDRAEYELSVIIQMSFTGYFLIVADFINWAKEHGIDVGPGRGSGAGSIVAYALQITDIDPLKYGLLFERFLNPERISMPDFDVDFCNERRQEVIDYVTGKYGKERVGQIITFGTLGAKQVIKDVARTLEISIPESEAISKLIPKDPKITLKKAFEDEPKLREFEQNPRYTELFTLARKLEGLHRHASLHAAGVVIGKSALHDFVPLYRDPKLGGIATQYAMGFLESCGLVKMDFLGLKTLDLIRHTGDLIRLRGGANADFDINTIDEHDSVTYTMLAEEKNEGIFQFEKSWWKDILKKAKPASIEELTALTSLGRPGPIQFIPQFIESKWNPKAIKYPDPSLEEILKETYGVIVYQEQVMQVARIIAGFTLGHADELRRAMGKKDMAKMVKEKEKFISGAVGRGYKPEDADRIFDLLIPFAGYGFNKSHAAAYSILSYRTAWLKANFPAEFMAANLTNEIGAADKDKLPEYIEVTRKMGIPIDPPDINRSDKFFTVVEGRIVYGFLGIKGLGDASAEEIINCRRDGPYKSFTDFLDRVNIKTVGKKVVEILAKTGAFDAFGQTRQTLVLNLDAAVDYAQNKKADKELGQASLFEDTDEQVNPDYQFTIHGEMDRMEKLNIEKELIGFYFSGHPMDDCREAWEQFVTLDLSGTDNAPEGDYTLIGILKTLKPYTNKSGKTMAFASLSDYRGEIDLVFFEKVWESCRNRIAVGDKIALKGRLDKQRGSPSIRVDSILDSDRVKIKEALFEYCSSEENAGSIASGGSADQGPENFAEDLNPLDNYKEAWEQFVTLDLSKPEAAPEGDYTLIGLLTRLKSITTKKDNKPMAFGSLADYKGEIDLVFFPNAWEYSRDNVEENRCIAVKGKLDKGREKLSFQVRQVLEIGKLRRKAAKAGAETAAGRDGAEALPPGPSCREVHIRLNNTAAEREENLFPLRDFLYGSAGSCPVFIHVPILDDEAVIRTASQISISADASCIEALTSCTGVAEVWRE